MVIPHKMTAKEKGGEDKGQSKSKTVAAIAETTQNQTDANNLVTTASAIHQPEQGETMHLKQGRRATVVRRTTWHMFAANSLPMS